MNKKDEKKDCCRQGKGQWPLLPLWGASVGARCWTPCGKAHNSWYWRTTATSLSSSCALYPKCLCSRMETGDPRCCLLHGKYGKWDHHWDKKYTEIFINGRHRLHETQQKCTPQKTRKMEKCVVWNSVNTRHNHKFSNYSKIYIYIFFLSLEKLPSQYNPIQSLPVEHLTAITVIFLKYLCALIGLSTEDSNRPSMAVTWVT